MAHLKTLTAVILACGFAACQSNDIRVADYCADPNKAGDKVCQLYVDIDGTRTALADTDMRLSDVRSIASSANAAAYRAQETADRAQATANEAHAKANSALASIENLHCVTNTINKSKIGTCPANFKLVSCTQTRYTYRAGGLSFLREINDEKCRFNSQVLEMQVRCCTVASGTRAANYSTPVTYNTH